MAAHTKSTFQYTNVAPYGNTLLVRGVDSYSHQRFCERVKFSPTLYRQAHSHESEKAKMLSVNGTPVLPIEFDTINDAKDYIKKFDGVKGREIYGNPNFIQQLLYTFPTKYDVSLLEVANIDIETEILPGRGMPNASSPDQAILLISNYRRRSNTGKVFGAKPFTGTLPDRWTYVQCKDEYDLLNKFLMDWSANYPDVVTGWNTEGFDWAYLIARMGRVLGEDKVKGMSPWGNVYLREETDKVTGKSVWTASVPGIAHLDLLQLYKKYIMASRESFSLAFIAEYEKVDVQKNTYDDLAGGFVELYTAHWDRFVRYNVDDVRAVEAIDQKFGYINLHCSVAYEAKENFEDAYSPVKTWESIIYNFFERSNTVFDPDDYKERRQYDGAYVKEPVPTLYGWATSVDATSLYPSIAMSFNISPDTKLGRIDGISPAVLLAANEPILTDSGRTEEVCMAANGVVFTTKKSGFIPTLFKYYFSRRKEAKAKMLELKKAKEALPESATHSERYELQNEISKYDSMQNAFKLLLNSAYGAMGNKWFRFYDVDLAEAITLTGQYIIQACEKGMNRELGGVGADVIYADTDSLYIHLQAVVEKYIYSRIDRSDTDQIVNMLERYVIDKVQPAIARIVEAALEKTGVFENRISFKLEGIGDHILFVSKKRYVMRVLYNEGVRYHEPLLKVMGLEIVRSTTPKSIRDKLMSALNYILDGKQDELIEYVNSTRDWFMDQSIPDISFARGVNGIAKYSHSGDGVPYKSGCPIHVRAAILYNEVLRGGAYDPVKYPPIEEGSKIKYCYLKIPNPIKENVLGFVNDIPPDSGLARYFDYDTMFKKIFLDPLEGIATPASLSLEEKASLDEFFG